MPIWTPFLAITMFNNSPLKDIPSKGGALIPWLWKSNPRRDSIAAVFIKNKQKWNAIVTIHFHIPYHGLNKLNDHTVESV